MRSGFFLFGLLTLAPLESLMSGAVSCDSSEPGCFPGGRSSCTTQATFWVCNVPSPGYTCTAGCGPGPIFPPPF